MKRSAVAWGVAGLGCFALLVFAAGSAFFLGLSGDTASSPFALSGRVGVADLEGVILSSEKMRETLDKFRKAQNVKAVVVHINSPGGGVAASQEIHSEIARFRRETKKPVIASMESVAASGGYYAAAAADKIVANPGTITGSIGVIIQWVNYGDLMEWAKLRPVTFTTGKLKDAGNPMRPMTDEEKAYFQGLIERLRGQFKNAVAEGRKGKLKPGTLDALSDGRVVAGDEALEMGLVDQIGDFRDAVDLAGKMAGLKAPAETWHPRPPRPGLLTILFGGSSDDSSRSSLAERFMSGVPVGGGWNVYFLW
jgi:protease-4